MAVDTFSTNNADCEQGVQYHKQYKNDANLLCHLSWTMQWDSKYVKIFKSFSYSWKNIPTKLLMWLIKRNIPITFLFACSHLIASLIRFFFSKQQVKVPELMQDSVAQYLRPRENLLVLKLGSCTSNWITTLKKRD